jgi:large subunit ribosomal protein L24
MHVKKGDNIIVIAGKDRGKKGKVVKAFPRKDAVIVEGINIVKKHQRAQKSGEQGQIVERPSPIHISNVKRV